MKKLQLSVVMPVHNTEAYLPAAINSVIKQELSFTDNIELILVDDGSTDKSGEVCKEYTERYPDNIRYIYQPNSGVSRARNTGFNSSTGKFIHFFDSDDILSGNFYKKSINFLRQHAETDVVASKLMFFDGIIDSHPLNFKFSSTRVIDLVQEPNNPLLHVISSLFRRSALSGIKFDERLSVSEDVLYLSDVLSVKKKLGVLRDTTYHYRKRDDGSSLIGSRLQREYNYLDVVDYAYTPMLARWHSASAHPSAIDYAILYDISYRLGQKSQTVLDDGKAQAYKDKLLKVATSLRDESIVLNQYLSPSQKMYILEQKYKTELASRIRIDGTKLFFDEYQVFDYRSVGVFFDFLTAKKPGVYAVEGYIDKYIPAVGVSYSILAGGKSIPLELVPRKQREQSFLGDIYDTGGAFEATVLVPYSSKLSVEISVLKTSIVPLLKTGRFTRFGALKLTYRRDSDRLWKREAKQIVSYPYSLGRHVHLELRMMFQIILNWRLSTMRERIAKLKTLNLTHLSLRGRVAELLKPFFFTAEALYTIPRAVFLRTSYYILNQFKKRPIWLIGDRGIAAGDNGEALFRYIMEQADAPADVYFVLSKTSTDLRRMQSIGKVLFQESLGYKLKFLLADRIISSQADIETTNPFIRQLDHYVDLFNFKFVFLQHGIIRHDLSGWLNRYDKDISLFITSAEKERNSIFDYPYYYPKQKVLLSGLPRYDNLSSEPAGKLILAPTYRKNLAKNRTNRIGVRGYDPDFRQSEYFAFYNNLMNDERLVSVMRKYSIVGEFCLHPAFTAQKPDFDENDIFDIELYPYDYQKAFREGNILISDHSSVVFDFAYLKKPVAYAHFDIDTFFDNHTYDKSNFFSDTDDGFGSVYYDYETLIKGVIATIEGGCKMPVEYQERVDRFFYRVDRDNCKRVYDAIIGLND